MRRGTPVVLYTMAVLLLLATSATQLYSSSGVPVLYRGVVVGCAEGLEDYVNTLARTVGNYTVYFFGIKGCLDCAEMERYLSGLAIAELAYVDVAVDRDLFGELIRVLSGYVGEEYLKEVPVVLVVCGGRPVVVSVGTYRNNTFWRSTLGCSYSPTCVPTPRSRPNTLGLLASAVALGLASSLSPCVLYLYTALLLSYTTSGLGAPTRRLLVFVAGLGLGYLAVVLGLSRAMAYLRHLSWVLMIALGVYMVLHSRGAIGCPVGGRACREVPVPGVNPLAGLGGVLTLGLGLLASLSAAPCSSGYYVVLYTASGGYMTTTLLAVYILSFISPYLVLSIASRRLLSIVERVTRGVAVVEGAAGVAMVALGVYQALGTWLLSTT
jgi:cytochrome c biogenesis protein CcdA